MENRRLSILLIEDDEDDYVVVRDLLEEASLHASALTWAKTYDEGLEELNRDSYDVCLLDYRLGVRSGLDLLREITPRQCRPPVILLTGQGDYAVDLEAMRAGAADYLVKGQIDASLLERSIRYAIERKQAEDALRRANRALRTLSECNQALVRETEEFELLNCVCRIIVESGGYNLAWVGYAGGDLQDSGGEGDMRLIARAIKPGNRPPWLDTGLEGRGGDCSPDDLWPSRDRFASSIELPLTSGERRLGTLNIYAAEPLAFGDEEVRLLTNLADNVSYGIAAIRTRLERLRAEEALRESEKQLRFLSSQLLSAQEEERKRIARELHDSIGSTLSAIKFSLETTHDQVKQGTASLDALAHLIDVTQEAINEVRRIMTDLRPSMLDDLGIVTTIGWFCRQFRAIYSSVVIEEDIRVDEEDVPEPLKIVIFRVIQEAFHNIAKYSKAELVTLSLMKTDQSLDLAIEDNGVGFDPGLVWPAEDRRGGIGLTSMKERTELSEGTFSIESTPGEGTTIRASWPVTSNHLVQRLA